MANYHISKDGTPGICKAEKGKCPLGASQPHFPDKYSAEVFSDNVNEIRASGELGGYTPDDKIEKTKPSQLEAEVYVIREMLEELEKNPASEDSWKVGHLSDEIARRQKILDESRERNERLGHTREQLKEKWAKKRKKKVQRYENGSRIPAFVTRGDSSDEIHDMGGADLVGRELSKAIDDLESVYELKDIKFHKNKHTQVILEDKETGQETSYEFTRLLEAGRTSGYKERFDSKRKPADKMSKTIAAKMTELAKAELDKTKASGVDMSYIPADHVITELKSVKGFYRSPAGSQATVKKAVKEMKSENIKYEVKGSSMEGYTWTFTGDDGEVKTVKTEPFFHKVQKNS